MAIAQISGNGVTPLSSRSWLTLIFRREGDRWALYHDQNTRIP